jgi:sugar lactone lactonase YvrE
MAEGLPTTVAGGFLLPEGARWHDGALWFVDMLRGNVHKLVDSRVETLASFDRPSSVGFRPNGDMLVVDGTKATVHTMRGGEVAESVDLSWLTPHLNDIRAA